ncbi:MAG: glycosyltransferase family 4 protein [Bdellovibrionota bacterium]
MQCYLYWSKALDKSIYQIVKEVNPDIVLCELVRMSLYRPRLNNLLVCELADLFSIRYRQQSKKTKQISSIMGQYSSRFWTLIMAILNVSWAKRLLLNFEMQLVEKAEKAIPKHFDLITLVSPAEVELLREVSGMGNIEWAPNGTNPPKYALASHQPRENVILFIGILNVPHNEEAVLHFVSNIYPRIKSEVPDTKFFVIGKNPTPGIESLVEVDESIILPGFVDDIELLIQEAKLFVAPMLSGSGVQTKLFEAMKYGIPVVSTELSARGIVNAEQSGFAVCNESDAFAAECIKILKASSSDWSSLGMKGIKVVSENYYWESVGKRFHSVFDLYRSKLNQPK